MLLNHCTLSTGSRTVALLILLFVFTPTSHADSYLADLENEANVTDVQIDEERRSAISGKGEALPSGMTMEEFERLLKKDYYSHFIFYEKLSRWSKKQVYKRYQTDNDIESIRHEITGRMPK